MRGNALVPLVALVLVAPVLSTCGGQDDMTRRKSEAALNKAIANVAETPELDAAFVEVIIGGEAGVLSRNIPLYSALKDVGYVRVTNRSGNPVAPIQRLHVLLTEEGTRASENWRRLEVLSGAKAWWRIPVAKPCVEVTGLRKISETELDADWTLEAGCLNKVGESLVEAGYMKPVVTTTRFELYDDGWRIRGLSSG